MSKSTAGISPLRQLADIISESVDKIDGSFGRSNIEYPSLNAPFNPTTPSEAAALAPEVVEAASLIVAACAQLSATVKMPALTLYDVVGGFHIASALRVALESNIVEMLRENPQGLHAKDISAQNGMDPIRISRILRLLATHHVFQETSPDVFTNNRLSSMMDTTKSVAEIKANPEDKHVGTPGMGALIEHCADETLKGSAFMTEVLLDPITGNSEAPEHAPMAIAFHSTKPSWQWYEEPGNAGRFKRYAAAMEGSARADPPNAILQGFKWGELPPQSVVVDVGGGIGHTTMKIIKQHPELKYIIQERPSVVKQANEYWSKNFPSALDDGSVTLQAHDFFTPQPVHNSSVFLCRMIMHDFGKNKATTILTHLRAAATPTTKLLLVDQIVPYACLDDSAQAIGEGIPGAEQIKPPIPLLANLGKANAIAYLGDFQMYVGLNGEERTLGTFIELTAGAGWKIVQIFSIPGSPHKQILAIPA